MTYTNVKAPTYGAMGDGTTDDTAAINAASLAASAVGGTVYFPPGTYLVAPTTTSWLKMYSNVTYQGAGPASIIKVKANAGNYQTVLGAPTTGARVVNATFRDLLIDQNQAGQTNATNPLGANSYQCGIFLQNGKHITVQDVVFECCGVNTVNLNGAGFADVGEYRVEGCTFRFKKLPNATHADSATQRAYDNSAIYLVGTGAMVTRNTFLAVDGPVGGARGACELHGPQMSFIDNRGDGYQTAVNLGTSLGLGSMGWDVAHNRFTRLNVAVRVVASSLYSADDTSITDNLFRFDTAAHRLSEGYGIWVAAFGEAANIDNVTIARNKLIFAPDTFTTTWAGNVRGVPDYFFGIRAEMSGVASNVDILDNLVVRAGLAGIWVGTTFPDLLGVSLGVRVLRNRLVDIGQGNNSITKGRWYLVPQGTLTDVIWEDNVLVDTRPPPATDERHYVYARAADLGTVKETWFRRNRLVLTNAVPGVWATAAFWTDWTKLMRDEAKQTVAPGTVAAGAKYTTTFTMPGAVVGDKVTAAPDGGLETGFSFFADVSAANTVRLSITNHSAAGIAAASRFWRFGLTRTTLDF